MSRRAGFLTTPCTSRPLRDPNAVLPGKAKTIPHLTQLGHYGVATAYRFSVEKMASLKSAAARPARERGPKKPIFLVQRTRSACEAAVEAQLTLAAPAGAIFPSAARLCLRCSRCSPRWCWRGSARLAGVVLHQVCEIAARHATGDITSAAADLHRGPIVGMRDTRFTHFAHRRRRGRGSRGAARKLPVEHAHPPAVTVPI